jgi:hypothetical protein
MIDREATERENKRPLTFASPRQTAIIEDVDLRVREENLHIRGPTVAAKSWIADALRHKACHDNRSLHQVKKALSL